MKRTPKEAPKKKEDEGEDDDDDEEDIIIPIKRGRMLHEDIETKKLKKEPEETKQYAQSVCICVRCAFSYVAFPESETDPKGGPEEAGGRKEGEEEGGGGGGGRYRHDAQAKAHPT